MSDLATEINKIIDGVHRRINDTNKAVDAVNHRLDNEVSNSLEWKSRAIQRLEHRIEQLEQNVHELNPGLGWKEQLEEIIDGAGGEERRKCPRKSGG